MRTRADVIAFASQFPDSYEDYPFHDPNWTVMRRRDTGHGFAWIYEREGNIWVNLKVEIQAGYDLRNRYPSILPAYHMNKLHWISVILDGGVPTDEIEYLISESYRLCGKTTKKK